jgi:hypothetical protein
MKYQLNTTVNKNLLQTRGYKECPAVTTGGKQFFYYRRKNNIKQWIVWNKVWNCWVYQMEKLKVN